jgi:prephenate dehydratase
MYLHGVLGAYSEVATIKAYASCKIVPCDQFEATFQVLMYFSKTLHIRVVIVIYNVFSSSFILDVTLSIGSFVTTSIHLPQVMELWLIDKTMLPIENLFNGSIHQNFNLHLRHCLHIVWEVQLLIHH